MESSGRKSRIRPTGAHWWTAAVTGFMLLFVGNGGVSWAEQTVPPGSRRCWSLPYHCGW